MPLTSLSVDKNILKITVLNRKRKYHTTVVARIRDEAKPFAGVEEQKNNPGKNNPVYIIWFVILVIKFIIFYFYTI